jgi:hypothetical protein
MGRRCGSSFLRRSTSSRNRLDKRFLFRVRQLCASRCASQLAASRTRGVLGTLPLPPARPPAKHDWAANRDLGVCAEWDEDRTLMSLPVEEDLPITGDMLDENGNCIACGQPFDETASHSFPCPCQNKVTITGTASDPAHAACARPC